MATKIVKYALLHYYKPYTDPFGAESNVERVASHGTYLTTDSAPEDPMEVKVNYQYDVPEKELQRLEMTYPDCFFSDGEIAAMEAGVSDRMFLPVEGVPQVHGDTQTTPAPVVPITERPTGLEGYDPHPLSFHELSEAQLAEYIKREGVSSNELLEIATASPDIADRILRADALAHGETREDLLLGMSQIRAMGIRGPEGSEGIEGTIGAPGTQVPQGESGEGLPESEEDTSDAPAKSASRGEWDDYAREQGLDPEEYTSKEELQKALGL